MAHKKLTTIFGHETKKICESCGVFLAAIVFLTELEKANYTVMAKLLKNLDKSSNFCSFNISFV